MCRPADAYEGYVLEDLEHAKHRTYRIISCARGWDEAQRRVLEVLAAGANALLYVGQGPAFATATAGGHAVRRDKPMSTGMRITIEYAVRLLILEGKVRREGFGPQVRYFIVHGAEAPHAPAAAQS